MDKKISEYLRLKDNHPTAIKLAKLCELADELGISLHYSNQNIIVSDKDWDRKLPPLYLEDIESNKWSNNCSISEFPPFTEYKLIYQNPEYIEQRRKEQEAFYAKKEEEARIEKERRLAKEKQEAEKRAKEKEASERKLLAELKAKYGDV